MARGGQRRVGPWLWAAGGCCAGCILIPILVVILGGAGLFAFLRSAGPQDQALERLRAHPEAVRALGEPIEAGWLVQGSVHVSDDDGTADLRLPVSGFRGEGTLEIVARKHRGAWEFDELILELEGRAEPIDLLAD